MSDLSRRDFLKLIGLGALTLAAPRKVFAAAEPRRYRVVQRIAPQDGVLMTVDDGYLRTFAPMVQVLYRRRVPVAFFAVGRVLPVLADYQGENLLEKLIEVGGIICNHSYSHPYFTHLDEKAIAEEIENWEAALADALGRDYLREMKARFPYFRIPFGAGKNLGRVYRVLQDCVVELGRYGRDIEVRRRVAPRGRPAGAAIRRGQPGHRARGHGHSTGGHSADALQRLGQGGLGRGGGCGGAPLDLGRPGA